MRFDESTMVLIFIVFAGLVAFIAITVSRRQKRRARESAMNLATTLGFELLEGNEAIRRSVPRTSEQSIMETYKKLPGPLRGLMKAAASFVIVGTVGGARIAIFLESRGSGKSRTTFTVVRADYQKPLPFELRIGYEGVFTRLGKALFGLRDVEIGDEEFDRAVRIKAGDEVAAKAMLGRPEARAAILGLLTLSRTAYATNSYVQWERQGVRFDESEIRSVIGSLVPVTRALGNA